MSPETLEPGAPVEIDDRNPPSRAEMFSQPLKVGNPIFEVVVSVHGKNEIDACGRKHRIVGAGENQFDVADAFFLNRFRHQVVHFPVDIHSIDFAFGSHSFGKPVGKVSAPRTQIGDVIAGAKRECFNDFLRLLPMIAVEAFIGPLLEKRASGEKEKGQPEDAEPGTT